MNMKKSIAGVMAGAMAVSAMAATVSAQDSISLTYDLKEYREALTDAKVTVIATYAGSLTNAWYTPSADVSADLTANGRSYITFGLDNSYVGDTNDKMTDFQVTATPVANVTNPDGPLQGTPTTISWTSDKSKTDGSHLATGGAWLPSTAGDYVEAGALGKAAFNMPVSLGQYTGELNMANYELGGLGYTTHVGEYGFQSLTVKMTYKIPAQVEVDGSNAWSWTPSAVLGAMGETAKVKKDMSAEIFLNNGKTLVNNYIDVNGNGTYDVNVDILDHVMEQNPVSVAVSAFTAGEVGDNVYPMKSALNKPANVITAIQARKAGGNHYTRPIAVINDAIANYQNVTFTFKSYDGYVATNKSHIFQQWVDEGRGFTYRTSEFDWYNPTFGQHLYTNVDDKYSLFGTTEYDMYGSYSDAWGINLFTGAIVVNSGLTMQLSDTDKFDWGTDTLTFDWFSITDEGKITDAKTFLTSMLLYTPVDWYWDSLTVVVTDEEGTEDSVDMGEGLDGEGEIIEEDPEIPDVVEEPAVETPVVEEPVDVTPVAPVSSPNTGNAPVALAVIPVALAAAAVVAKKRG